MMKVDSEGFVLYPKKRRVSPYHLGTLFFKEIGWSPGPDRPSRRSVYRTMKNLGKIKSRSEIEEIILQYKVRCSKFKRVPSPLGFVKYINAKYLQS